MTCNICGYTISDEDEDFIDDNGHHICDTCKDKYIVECEDCGILIYKDDAYIESDNYYCCDCFNDRTDSRKIKDYHEFDGRIKFFGDDEMRQVPYLGIELEIDSDDKGCGFDSDENEETAESIEAIMPNEFIHFENDGSLDDGFENITQPATLEYHTSLKSNYKEMFKLAIKKGYRSHQTSSCGLHIHFNRSFFSKDEDLYVTRLLYLVEKFWLELSKFSRRSLSNINSWAKKYDEKPDEIVRKSKCNDLNRYYAINLTNCDTIEFRIFRGTLKYNTFISSLQLVDTMVRKVRDVTEIELQSLKWEDLLEHDEIKAYWETVKDRKIRKK